MKKIGRRYLGVIQPKSSESFSQDHLATVAASSDHLRAVEKCWFVDDACVVNVFDTSDIPGLAEVIQRSRVIGVLAQMISGEIWVSGEPDRMLSLCKGLADELGGRFKKARARGLNYSHPPEALMQVAIAESDVTTIKKLIKSGVDPNGIYPPDPYPDVDEPYGQSFLTTAAILNDPDVCELLVDSGALPNEIVGDTKFPPLLSAANKGAKQSFEFLKRCTDRRFHPAARQSLKDSRLTESQFVAITELEWSIVNQDGNPLKDLKAREQVLRSTGRIAEIYGRLLHMACAFANLKVVQYLLDQGAKTEVVNEDGATPLFHCQNPKVCELMLDYGAKPNAKNCLNETPLMFVGMAEAMHLMLDYGAKANAKNVDGYGTIIVSTRSFYEGQQRAPEVFEKLRKRQDKIYAEVLERLIEGKAKVQEQFQSTGLTALMMLAELEFEKSVRKLLDAGADPNVEDHNGKLAWQFTQNTKEAKLLQP